MGGQRREARDSASHTPWGSSLSTERAACSASRQVAAPFRWHSHRADRRVVSADCRLQPQKLRPRVHAQLLAEHTPGIAECLERLRLASTAIQGEHQLTPHALLERILGQRTADPRHQLCVIAKHQPSLELLLQRIRASRPSSRAASALSHGVAGKPCCAGPRQRPTARAESSAAPPASPTRKASRAPASRSSNSNASTLAPTSAYPPLAAPIDSAASALRSRETWVLDRVARLGRHSRSPQRLDQSIDPDGPPAAPREQAQAARGASRHSRRQGARPQRPPMGRAAELQASPSPMPPEIQEMPGRTDGPTLLASCNASTRRNPPPGGLHPWSRARMWVLHG